MAWSILAADIGGTNSRFARFEGGPDNPLVQLGPREKNRKWLKTAESASFRELLDRLRNENPELAPERADMVVLAVAGPVERGRYCDPPNIAWDLDIDRDGLPASRLLNDFAAQAFACRSPVINEAEIILPGTAQPDAVLACVGAGTGLGSCALAPDEQGGHLAIPSEGGHGVFPFVSREEQEFAEFARARLKRQHIIGDLVVTGLGLRLLHSFHTGEELKAEEITDACSPESATLTWFSRFYGRACRQYALQVLALAGVYLAGGIAATSEHVVRHPAFAEEFRASETHGRLLANIPVFLNKNVDSGLWGAAQRGLELLRREA